MPEYASSIDIRDAEEQVGELQYESAHRMALLISAIHCQKSQAQDHALSSFQECIHTDPTHDEGAPEYTEDGYKTCSKMVQISEGSSNNCYRTMRMLMMMELKSLVFTMLMLEQGSIHDVGDSMVIAIRWPLIDYCLS